METVRSKVWIAPFRINEFIPTGYLVETFTDEQHKDARSKGFLFCDGRGYDPAQYPELKKVLGDSYGIDKLPDTIVKNDLKENQ